MRITNRYTSMIIGHPSTTNGQITISRNGDLCVPLLVHSENPVEHISIEIGGTIVCRIPMELCTMSNDDGKFVYHITWDQISMDPINLRRLSWHQVDCYVKSTPGNNSTLYGRYYTYSDKTHITGGDQHQMIKSFVTERIYLSNGVNVVEIYIQNGTLFRGIFPSAQDQERKNVPLP